LYIQRSPANPTVVRAINLPICDPFRVNSVHARFISGSSLHMSSCLSLLLLVVVSVTVSSSAAVGCFLCRRCHVAPDGQIASESAPRLVFCLVLRLCFASTLECLPLDTWQSLMRAVLDLLCCSCRRRLRYSEVRSFVGYAPAIVFVCVFARPLLAIQVVPFLHLTMLSCPFLRRPSSVRNVCFLCIDADGASCRLCSLDRLRRSFSTAPPWRRCSACLGSL